MAIKLIDSFEDILGDERLYAVKYKGDEENILSLIFNDWNDVEFLSTFFKSNFQLLKYFKVRSVREAVINTIDESEKLESILCECDEFINFDEIFEPLGEIERKLFILQKVKTFKRDKTKYKGWLRIYALKLEDGIYIITGGAIKLTRTMIEAENTKSELLKLEQCRNFLSNIGVIDESSFSEYLNKI